MLPAPWSVTLPDTNRRPRAEELPPTTTLMDPLRPPVADPLMMDTQPLLPIAELPLDTLMLPDAPLDNTLDVVTMVEPEPQLALLPPCIETGPPMVPVASAWPP